jgi:hypothetical protein
MAYGTVKVDNITFDQGGADQNVTASGIYRAITSGVTVSGTIAGAVLIGTTIVSGTTVTGTTVQGTTIQGVSGTFTSLTGITVTGTTANFTSGVFTTQISGLTVTGTQSSFTSGNFVTLSGVTATFTSGVIAAGTAAAPSLSILGDPNTGIYSPGADQVAISTNGTGHLVVDASGNINLNWGVPRLAAVFDNNFRQGLAFDTASRQLQIFSTTNDNGGSIGFYTRNAAGGSITDYGTERMRLDSSGRLGVGTTSPNAALDVVGSMELGTKGASNTTTYLDITSDTTYTDYGFRIIRGGTANGNTQLINRGTGALELNCVDGGFLAFSTSNAERLRIDSSGSVGIGTSSPTTVLDISVAGGMARIGSGSGNNLIQAYTGTVGIGMWAGGNPRFYSTGGMIFSVNSTVGTSAPTGYVDAMTIDSSGRVGIGTSSPNTLLHVLGGDLKVQKSSLNLDSVSEITLSNVYRTGRILSSYTNPAAVTETYIAFHTNRTGQDNDTVGEVMRIAGGNVGIGTSSPLSGLHLANATVGSAANFTISNPANTWSIRTGTTDNALVLIDAQFSAERARINNIGHVGIGTSLPRGQLSIANNLAGTGAVDSTLHFGYSLADYYGFRIVNTNDASSTSAGLLRFQRGTTLAWADLLTIDNGGRVGIGTTSPSYSLDIVGSPGVGLQILENTSANTRRLRITQESTGVTYDATYGTGDNAHLWLVGGTERARIDSSGRVGIGTSDPGGQGGQKLTVSDGFIAVSTNVLSGTSGELRFIGRPDGINYSWAGIRAISDININQGVLAFFTSTNNTSGEASTERARIDSLGRLLVGTSSARSLYGQTGVIQTEGIGYASSGINIILNNNSAAGPLLQLAKSRGTANGSSTIVQSGDTLGSVYFCGADGSDLDTPGGGIACEVDGTPGANDMPGRLVFSTTADGSASPTERMRIDSTGTVLIGMTSSSYLAADNGIQLNASGTARFGTTGTGATNVVSFVNGTNGTPAEVGLIQTSGSSTTYATSSDYRLKENVTAVIDGINRLQQLKPSRFNFIADPDHTVDGFIAHEAQAVVPECVTGEKDAVDDDGNPVYQGIDQSKLVPLLTAALQEAIARIKILEDKVAALEGS